MFTRLFLVGLSFAFVLLAPARAQFIISEFMADNVSAADVDEDTSHSDWLEIQNIGGSAASLNGWYLTDDAGNLRQWQFPVTTPAVTLAPGARLVVWCSDKNRKAAVNKLHTNFKLSNNGEYLALVRPDGVTVEHGYTPAYPPQFPNGTYGTNLTTSTVVLMAEGGPGKAAVPTDATDFANNFAGWNTPAFNDSAWQSGNGGFGNGASFASLIGANGTIATPNHSCFMRFNFNLASLTGITSLRLRVNFDDGYICYLNGTKIYETFAPGNPTWDSSASLHNGDSGALSFRNANVSNISPLVAGNNVLAFHAVDYKEILNDGVTDDGLVLRPRLEADVVSGTVAGYLTTSTRGATNTAIKTQVGPSISDTTDHPPQPVGGVGSAPLVISTKITQTLRPITTVLLKYRRMYENETSVVMVDNGTNGDAVSGDKIYTAQVPTTALLQGEMIRWRIEAKDSGNINSYDPPYPAFSATSVPANPPPQDAALENEMYFGTVATPVMVGSTQLPVLHWFVPAGSEGAAETETGTRCSFFFQPISKDNPGPGYVPPKPQFYDNVLVRLHGQSSGGFPKRSHDLNFSKDRKFEWKDGEPDSSGVNLLSNYADKSKVRNTLAWDTWSKSGHIASHYSFLVRVHRNATFRGLYDIVESANASFLERSGLDKGDALYKVYNSLENANSTTTNGGGSEKKNPDDSDFTDLAAMVAGINQAALSDRVKFLYDNVDIESLINFLAVHSIVQNRDFGHKNYYVHRDTFGTGEWSPVPWDQDLSFGHTWNGTSGYFDDDIHSQGPLQTGGGGNKMMQIVYSAPELNAMFLRRLRTLADQMYGGPTETNGPLVQLANATLNKIDPNPNNPAAGTDDADLEMRTWGFWVDGSGGQIAYTDSRVLDHTVRAQGARITHTNPIPPYTGSNPYAPWGDNSTSLLPYIPGRRDFFYSVTPPTSSGLSFPSAQPATPTLVIEQINPNPVAAGAQGTQDAEYFVIKNTNTFAVDISGWKLSGDISLTFKGGTVIPGTSTSVTSGSTAAGYINQMVVANKPKGFRQRATSPKAAEFRFVAGPYDRQLSARGGSIVLSKPIDPLNPAAGYTPVITQNFTATPTAHQNYLRITELNYDPAPPTSAELATLPGLVAGDFEFIEFVNAGPTPLNLGKAYFDEGIGFTFPDGFVLSSGQRCVIVASVAAFQARYGTGFTIAGNWEGALNNGGERLRIVDPAGEEVLDFTYDGNWYPQPPGVYRSLVTRAAVPAYNGYSTASAWGLSTTQNGTPTAADPTYGTVYEGWRLDYFSTAELPTLASPNLPAALLQDPDGDGMNNFHEFVFGRNPKVADNTSPMAWSSRMNVSGADYLSVTFDRPRNALDVTYLIEASTDLSNPNGWSNVGILADTVDLGGGRERVTFRDNTPIASGPRHLRVRAVKN